MAIGSTLNIGSQQSKALPTATERACKRTHVSRNKFRIAQMKPLSVPHTFARPELGKLGKQNEQMVWGRNMLSALPDSALRSECSRFLLIDALVFFVCICSLTHRFLAILRSSEDCITEKNIAWLCILFYPIPTPMYRKENSNHALDSKGNSDSCNIL